ncbi:MAG: crossover junction endodeoxyribonuclease RuvC [Syntrophotalea acetylenica]|jgi:crossover junction endodeoxyribonuclease RuvC|uniref:Crossover junction endodeoxyribonuclease RuvC n=1 Tax=Syntrophotalea acetylenica TaxID=29542 RepID=A0A1L3GHX4_SYNAC|nr:crossover junction endodeoxyribonuclease RuvC [Syntrophotalea acetylenica]APG25258.1 crossover junction endodeoxyribonuclease RuvC [Syntrophotalea acetylenica]APG43327.1 crossover junction endodeoxyribonuclease RuvC [Syntrophotalea acetylenica]MDD4456954.1 crossover junction endodeoxyribonuclease RuvC [Syntrophotalea acetylenica]MDY0263019.1 crossover junction endodeoxyribonuclease RuvC [Syntrophotalea acetylenica]
MRILGIDPGTRITGYGLIEKIGNRLLHVDNGAIHTRTDAPLAERLKTIYDGLSRVIRDYGPASVAVERIFVAKNALSALKLGHARGVAMLAGVNAALPVAEYTAVEVKQAVVGYGKAAKPQVQQMVRVLLNLPEIAQEDASDALAVAICHAHCYHLKSLLI